MSTVYVFPGQGSQRKGMGKELFTRFPTRVAEANELLGYSLVDLCLEDRDDLLNRTDYTQPALYIVNVLHYLARVEDEGERPAVVAGHSLGEYCALFAAGAFDFATGLRLVQRRGQLMSEAPKGAMVAVIKLDQERVAEVLAQLPYSCIDIANINSPTQTILSGVYDELLAPDVREAYEAAGALFMPLNVSAAFHSRLMVPQQEAFARFLSTFELAELRIPVIANLTARPYPATGYASYLTGQFSSPVRWYESVSWVIHRGHRDFAEVGPGSVLTRLNREILRDPLPVQEDEAEPRDRPTARLATPKVVFMYAGQGTQYFGMGRELYDSDASFRATMDSCNEAVAAAGGPRLLDAIYDVRRGLDDPFDDIAVTHPALYSIGYALTQMLLADGFAPDAVLGHSLGELLAAVAAGALSFDEGLRLVLGQVELLRRTPPGGMLSVLAAPAEFHERRDLFAGVTLAGVSFNGNFIVSGAREKIEAVQGALDREGLLAVRLPVRQGFHSELMDPIRSDWLTFAAGVKMTPPRLSIYSSVCAGPLQVAALSRPGEYLWSVLREEMRFGALIESCARSFPNALFVDLSATGSLANFVKHGYGSRLRSAAAMNQFGHNAASVQALRKELREREAGGVQSAQSYSR